MIQKVLAMNERSLRENLAEKNAELRDRPAYCTVHLSKTTPLLRHCDKCLCLGF